jgi:hypothetical protein
MSRRLLGLSVMALAIAVPPVTPAFAGPTVTVRVEGQRATLLAPTRVTLGDTPVVLADATCPANSAAAALDRATGGNWDRAQFTSTILGESHTFTASDYWAEWVNNRFGGGICSDLLNEGDELLMLVDVSDAAFSPTVFPLVVGGVPAAAAPGTPFTVTVTQFRTAGTPGTSTPEPAAGVSVTAGGATATTGPDGRATLTVSSAGATTLRAVRGGARSVIVPLCLTDGADGACGTTATVPGGAATGAQTGAQAGAPSTATGAQGVAGLTVASVDRTAPHSRLVAPRDGTRYRHAVFSPRALRIAVAESGSGVLNVKLRLTRRLGDRCWSYSGRSERFIGQRCGQGFFFKVADTPTVDYLLPEKLPRGEYVLDVKATDKAFNRDTVRQRGRNRVVFAVR